MKLFLHKFFCGKIFAKALVTGIFCLVMGDSRGQILTFDFAGLAGNEATANSNFNDAGLTSSTISRGAGLTASNNMDRFNAINWALTSIANALTGNKYMEFTITPNATYQFSITSIVINLQRSGTGPSAVSLRSSVDGYSSDLDGVKTIIDNTTTQSLTFTFSQASTGSAVTYRFYMYAEDVGGSGGIGDGTGNDIIINGSVSTGSGSSSATDYFRSRQTGNWSSASTWESSSDNSNWINATLSPTSSANTIRVWNNHTVTINANSSADQLTVESGATLNHTNGITFTLNDGSGNDMTVIGTYVINGTMPSGSGTTIVNSGGIVRADGNSSPGESDNFAFSTSNSSFLTGSIFEWNSTSQFGSSNVTYFSSATEKPTFRVTSSISLAVGAGAGNNTTIRGLLEVNGSVSFDLAGTKTFRDGIIGTGTINQVAGSGALYITANDAQLGGSGAINLNSTSGLQISSAAIVTMISNKIVNGSTNDFTVASGGRLNCSTYVISGTADFVLADGGTLGIGSTGGIASSGATGNIQTTGRIFSSAANYIYNGSGNQITGNFTTAPTANTVNFLTAASGGTVTLTNTNLTATALYLNTGYFASGTGQNLNIAAGGNIYGNGGANPNSATAGSITFLGTGTTHGLTPSNPSLYHVIIGNGVNFNGTGAASATIMNTLQLNSGGFVSQAPFYQTGSTLIYNTGGVYGRNVEWGSASNQGYPHHVTVQGNTIVDLNTNAIVPAQLSLAGDLTIGNSTGRGEVYMNNGMNKPLQVYGNLVIGNSNAAADNSILYLSTTGGGDLWLHGNFTRYNNSFYTENSRAIYFKGTTNSTINTPNITITPGVPTQYFSYFRMDKTNANYNVTLDCPVGIYNEITLTKGNVVSTNTNQLVMNNGSTVVGMNYGTRVSGGSDSSFVNGPMKKIGNSAFVFPVGKPFASNPITGVPVGGHHIIAISGPGNATDAFVAEYYLGDANLMGPIVVPASPWVVRVSACEYWRLEKETAPAATVNVTLSWTAKSNCNVKYVDHLPTLVIVHNTANSSNGTAPFTGNWDNFGNDGGTTGTVAAGTITWNNVSTFSPFALGTTNMNTNPLPLNLNRFNATPAKKAIDLEWAVGNNDEQQSYTLERSKDGINFEAITNVAALKDIQVAEYVYADEQPLTGWNYYRLRATDHQLKQATSRIVRVWWGTGPAVVSVLPNPATEKIVINLPDPSSITEIQIVNVTGQVLKQIKSVQFTNEITISSLQAGMYYIRLFGKNGLITKTFIKQ
jgi:hypothetical protein